MVRRRAQPPLSREEHGLVEGVRDSEQVVVDAADEVIARVDRPEANWVNLDGTLITATRGVLSRRRRERDRNMNERAQRLNETCASV